MDCVSFILGNECQAWLTWSHFKGSPSVYTQHVGMHNLAHTVRVYVQRNIFKCIYTSGSIYFPFTHFARTPKALLSVLFENQIRVVKKTNPPPPKRKNKEKNRHCKLKKTFRLCDAKQMSP